MISEPITISLSGAAWLTLFIGMIIGFIVGMGACLYADNRDLKKELEDTKWWTGWHKGWKAAWNSAKNPDHGDLSSCGECKHRACEIRNEPCRTCIEKLVFDHTERAMFDPIEEKEEEE